MENESVNDTLQCYIQFRTQPIVDEVGFFSFMENSTKIRRHGHLSNFEDDVSLQRNSANLCTELWNTFSFESMCA